MMDPTLLELVCKERVNDLLREAAAERLVMAAGRNDPRPGRHLRVVWPRLAWPNLTLTLARLRRNVAL
jgi:hypothetical protein